MTSIRKGAVRLKGNPVDLIGPELKVGSMAPEFSCQASDLSLVTLKNFAGKKKIIFSVPSLDTATCDKETKRLSEEVAKLKDIQMICVSMDLPFAQKRWCGAAGAENITYLSDHQGANFGEHYGVLIDSNPLKRLLARAVFVIGADEKLKHVEYVGEIAEEPNYSAVLTAARG